MSLKSTISCGVKDGQRNFGARWINWRIGMRSSLRRTEKTNPLNLNQQAVGSTTAYFTQYSRSNCPRRTVSFES